MEFLKHHRPSTCAPWERLWLCVNPRVRHKENRLWIFLNNENLLITKHWVENGTFRSVSPWICCGSDSTRAAAGNREDRRQSAILHVVLFGSKIKSLSWKLPNHKFLIVFFLLLLSIFVPGPRPLPRLIYKLWEREIKLSKPEKR